MSKPRVRLSIKGFAFLKVGPFNITVRWYRPNEPYEEFWERICRIIADHLERLRLETERPGVRQHYRSLGDNGPFMVWRDKGFQTDL